MLSHLSRFVTLRALAGATSVALAGATGSLRAADPLPAPAPVVRPVAISDVTLSRAILTALDADPQLKSVNLVVSVVDRGVVVGGPVASDEVRKRVEVVVRGVAGVESVKNTCFVDAAPEPLLRAVAERLKPDAAKPTVAALPGVVPPPNPPDGFIPPLAPQPPTDLVVNTPKPVETLRPSLAPVNVLGGPVAAPGTGGVPKVNPLPTVAPPPARPLFPTAPVALNATPAASDLPTALARLQKEERFKGLKVESKANGELQVTGSAAKPADVWAFIAELRKVPALPRTTPHPDLVR